MSIKGAIVAHSRVREATLSAVVTRADGRVEDLGVIARYHAHPLKRLAWRVKDFFSKGLKR